MIQKNIVMENSEKNHKDEREKANNGDWNKQRPESEKQNEGYDGENKNDNSGGAGSTGSAATNS